MSRTPHVRRANRPADSYTLVSNEFCRSKLPPRAKVVALLLLSHRDGYAVTQERIAEELGMSVRTVADALGDLEKANLCVREQVRDDQGHVLAVDWIVSDTPFEKNQLAQSAHRASPIGPAKSAGSGPAKSADYKKTKEEDQLTTPDAVAPEQIELPLPVPAALEKDAEDGQESKPLTLNQRATQAAQWYYRHLGNMGNVPAMMKIIRKAMVNGHSNTQIKTALTFIADHRWTLTEERLAHALQGGPRPVSRPTNGTVRRKVYQLNPDGTSSGREIQVDW